MLFNNLSKNDQRRFVLNRWIMKESAFKWQKNKSPVDYMDSSGIGILIFVFKSKLIKL